MPVSSAWGVGIMSRVIEVLNWDKFNGRRDVKHSSWFRFEHSLVFDPEWSHLTAEEMWVWASLMSLCSLKNRSSVVVDDKALALLARVSEVVVSSTIQKLTNLDCVRVRTGHVSSTYRKRIATDGRTDGRTGPTDADSNPLAGIWNRYCGELAKVRGCDGKRKISADQRWNENPSTEYWGEIVQRIAKSDFCLGKKNIPGTAHSNWRAGFDFLIRPDTQHKVLEGKYDEPNQKPQPKMQTPEEFRAEQLAKQEADDARFA